MGIFESIILGLVQGLTEFVPVSSSGHLLLAHKVFGNTESSLVFDVALHVGTLLALLVYFRNDILLLIKNVFAKNEHGRLARLLVYATIPALVGGLLFSDYIDNNLRSPAIVAVGLLVVGIIMLFADRVKAQKYDEVDLKKGMLMGVAQTAALMPGVSRSGATITIGLFLGLAREQATRFSFLLAMPIVAGSAAGLILKGSDGASESAIPLILGMSVAFISGLFAIKFMLKSIAKLGLKPFAYYRIALALIVFLFML